MSDLPESKKVLQGRQQQQQEPMIASTPRPSVVFSTTSSTESSVDSYPDDRFVRYDEHDEDGDCKVHCLEDDHEEWIEADDENENENRNREHPNEEAEESTERVAIAASESIAETKKISKVEFWRTRIAELFVIQIALFTLISLQYQHSNRLTLTSATIVGALASETRTTILRPWSNETTTAKSMDGTLGEPEDCIYVPGAGFSGFWYSLGRLNSLEDPLNETFLCYSAGCISVVANLLYHEEFLKNADATDIDTTRSNQQYNDLYDMARFIQVEWVSGKLHRYRVAEAFLDKLLEKFEEDFDDDSRALFLDTIRSKVNIVTTAFEEEADSSNGGSSTNSSSLWSSQIPSPESILPRAFVRRPSDIPTLKRLLLQSAWIPLATGSSWTHRGHMDGLFSFPQHPRCSRTVGLTQVSAAADVTKKPSSWHDFAQNQILLWSNILNIKLSREDVGALWKIGMEYGV